MVNFADDTENEEDYETGWEWYEQDSESLVAPYSGFHQCLLDPTKQKPEDFFDALFSTQMYTIMAEQTNNYVQRKMQRGKFSKISFICINTNVKLTKLFSRTLSLYLTRSHSLLLKQSDILSKLN